MKELRDMLKECTSHPSLGFVHCSNLEGKWLKHLPIFVFPSNKLCHHTNCYDSEWLADNNCSSTTCYIPREAIYKHFSPEENMKHTLACREVCLQKTGEKTEVPSI
jgi:hypothetical protein